jgi:CHRD domain
MKLAYILPVSANLEVPLMMPRLKHALIAAAALMTFAAAPVSAQTFTLTANLHGGEETPAVIVTGAFGTATVTVDMATRTITWTVDVFNLPSGVTAGHIHVGAPGAGGPTMVNFTVPTNASNDFRISGSATDSGITLRPEQGIRSADDAYQAILGGNTYVNVHSNVNQGGEIRGQLKLVQP